MSDVVIVSADVFRNGHAPDGVVPYGTIFDDDATGLSDGDTIESMFEGAVPAVDWRGVDQVDKPIGPTRNKPGRPKGSKNKVR